MGYVHFVRSPYAHAKIVSIDVSKALELGGVYGTLTGRRGRDPHRSVLRAVRQARRGHQGLRARGRPRAPRRRAGRRGRRVLARARARRRRARRGRVRAAAAGRRRPRTALRNETILHDDAGSNVVWAGLFDWGDYEGAVAEADNVVKIERLHFDRFSSTPLECAGVPRRVQPRHRPVDALRQPPDARHRRDLDGARAAHRHRQAALRLAGHRRRVRQQDLPPPAVRRVLPARAQAEAAGAVDGVAHRPAHGERARQRAHVPRHRGAGEGGRDAARAEGARARRLRRVPALRAARLHHLGAGHARAATAGATSASTSRRCARTSRRCRRTAATRACSISG